MAEEDIWLIMGRIEKAAKFCRCLAGERLCYLDIISPYWDDDEWELLAERHGLNFPSPDTVRLIKGMMKGAYRRGDAR